MKLLTLLIANRRCYFYSTSFLF